MNKRLESLDILRGMDLFLLTCLGGIICSAGDAFQWGWLSGAAEQCEHVEWTGFHVWDQIMPLFMFMAGVSIPFAFSRYREERRSGGQIYWRIFRRFAALWVLGMVCQGNLLNLIPGDFKPYSNTLQTIAAGYLVSSLMFLHTKPRTQIITALFLLAAYWAAMSFISVEGCGGGDFSRDGNLCEWVDNHVLGRFRHYAEVAPDGTVSVPVWYRYTWILSTLNFIVTVMSGMFAGEVLCGRRHHDVSKALFLVVLGAVCIAAGLLWNLQMPIIKTIWTSSMTVFSTGISFVLMGVVFYVVDCLHWTYGLGWLKYFGMNSILVYMIGNFVSFNGIADRFIYGLGNYVTGPVYDFIVSVCGTLLFTWLLRILYRNKVFLRV